MNTTPDRNGVDANRRSCIIAVRLYPTLQPQSTLFQNRSERLTISSFVNSTYRLECKHLRFCAGLRFCDQRIHSVFAPMSNITFGSQQKFDPQRQREFFLRFSKPAPKQFILDEKTVPEMVHLKRAVILHVDRKFSLKRGVIAILSPGSYTRRIIEK